MQALLALLPALLGNQAVQAALPSVLAVLLRLAPELLAAFGAQKFPDVRPEDTAHAAASALNPDAVRYDQAILNLLFGAELNVDGDPGPLTQAAVKKFQAGHGLEVDGWAGKLTRAALRESLAKVKLA